MKSSEQKMIPYGMQSIDDDDIAAVVATLRGDWLTQGPGVAKFEEAFAAKVGVQFAVAVNSGTAALHACTAALGIGPGDEVIVPAITFTATANCVVFQGGTPVFADVDSETGLIDPAAVAKKITARTKAIIAMDYAGMPCDYDALQKIADANGLTLIADACHALGATYRGRPVGSIAKLNCFSFHPVKHIATGEGGMITTDDAELAQRMRDFRTHGITKEATRFMGLGVLAEDEGDRGPKSEVRGPTSDLRPPTSVLGERGPWYYEMQSLGFNYRISDINCALGSSQLAKLDRFVARRREISAAYGRGLSGLANVKPAFSDLNPASGIQYPATHSFHLYPVLVDFAGLGKTRTQVMSELRARGVGTQVHYIPVNLQPFYRERFGTKPGDCTNAEEFYARELSLPMFPAMTDADVSQVIAAVREVLSG